MSSATWNESTASRHQAESSATSMAWALLKMMGSLRITVSMFALGMIVLFFGTLAQDEETLVDVKNNYFNSWIATVPLDVLLPVTIFPDHDRLPFVIPMPGGAAIGFVLLLNLIAAKLTRFKMHAKGGKLIAGLFFCVLGAILVGLIVVGAHRGDGLQGEPPFSYDFLWSLCKYSVWVLTAGALAWVIGWPAKTTLVRVVSWVVFILFFGLSLFLLITQDQFRIPDPGLRITWQLTKSLLVGVVLLIGLMFLFGSRGGNVLIHLGVGLLMLGQFIFGDQQVEERITLHEGEITRVAYQLDTVELAFVESANETEDRVIGVDSPFLEKSERKGQYLEDDALPVDILVRSWFPNHDLGRVAGDNPATAGAGLQFAAKSIAKFSAAQSEKVNLAGGYFTFRDKTGKDLGTYLLSQFLHDPNVSRKPMMETLQVGEKSYQLQLRFKNAVKPYQITLDDVKRENYSGSMTPRDFSSDVRIVDEAGNNIQKGHIWMNNPMRFRGESFYQSSYGPADPRTGVNESTTLQVVTNAGWLIPYVSCVICGLGMLVHFGETFARFAGRYDRMKVKPFSTRGALLALVGLLLPTIYVAYKAMPPRNDRSEFKWYEAGKLPMLHEGRIKPLDTVARNTLLAVSNRSKLVDKDDNTIKASQWLLSTIAEAKWTKEINCIRIDSKEVLDTLGLTRREGHRYSYNEVAAKIEEVRGLLSGLDPELKDEWTFEQKKLAELSSRFGIMEVLIFAHRPLVPNVPNELSEAATDQFWREKRELEKLVQVIEREAPPSIIPPFVSDSQASGSEEPKAKWQAYGPAYFRAFEKKLEGIEVDRRALNKFSDLTNAIRENDSANFNNELREFQAIVAETAPPQTKLAKIAWEAWYNHLDPITLCNVFYVFAAVIGLLGFVIWFEQCRTAAFWICLATFGVHTFAIGMRVYLSDRPPVVNLYSSAVFIGWAVVLFGLVIEKLFPLGFGLLTGSVFGFLSLLVAYGLDTSDTMPVLQAVLDTQFWLATHVICITLGYSATFFAGAVGIVFLGYRLAGILGLTDSSAVQAENEKIIDRISYGIVCFAIFFSFVGTVLGGLWGDDSWGRFWGWDPKENGALMIVLWNALLIHARWDKLVTGRGFAILAVAGNIVTAWSWFGTNQLGIGLHSYGFNKSVLYWLAGFVLSQILIMILGAFLAKPPANNLPGTAKA